ncbi:MAG: HAD family phosphatase [Terracidiphilus sp.]|jgi:beta-phosphoglucomutase
MAELREALVFDYDGVIADTEPLHWKSWAALLSRYGIQLGWEEYCRIGRGVSDAELFEHFGAQMPPADADDLSRLNRERKQMVRDWSLAGRPIPRETIAMFRSLGNYRVGLVTSSEQAEVEPVLRAAEIYHRFDGMVFGGESAAPKPSPAPYLLIAERLGVQTGIAFEDSEPGIASARAAGFRAVRIARPCDLAKIVAISLR